MVAQLSNNSSEIPREEYLKRSREQAEKFQKMAETPEDQVLREFNQRYAVVRTSTTYILVQKDDMTFELDSRRSFLQFHENDFFLNSSNKRENKAYFWLKHPNRRTYENIVFDPARPGDYGNSFNIFKGFAVKPIKGDCGLYRRHILEVICSGNLEYFNYVWKWMACVIQKPTLLATALVLRGLQGTGKGQFIEYFGRLFGHYFLTVTSLEHITGKFNNHLKYAYLINANEAFWGGHRKEVGALKALITDRKIMIEAKGKDPISVDNCRHLIVSTNEDWAVPMDLDDRRFFVLDVSACHKEDTQYFDEMRNQMEQGGTEALLYDLLQEDLSAFDPRKMPLNDFGFDMKLKTAGSVEKFLYEALKEGRFGLAFAEGTGPWQPTGCKQVHDYYKEWCKSEGLRYESNVEFGRVLKKIFSITKRRPCIEGVREWQYDFPPLAESRAAFEKFTKQSSRIWEE
jgi:hypothetical protein